MVLVCVFYFQYLVTKGVAFTDEHCDVVQYGISCDTIIILFKLELYFCNDAVIFYLSFCTFLWKLIISLCT